VRNTWPRHFHLASPAIGILRAAEAAVVAQFAVTEACEIWGRREEEVEVGVNDVVVEAILSYPLLGLDLAPGEKRSNSLRGGY